MSRHIGRNSKTRLVKIGVSYF